MYSSKTDRILSRYRPIAPKPSTLPLPSYPSSTTDPSSTCASVDSLASSGKRTRPRTRKRRGASIGPDPSSLPKVPKPSPLVPAASGSSFVAAAGRNSGPLTSDGVVSTESFLSYKDGSLLREAGFAVDSAMRTASMRWANGPPAIDACNLGHVRELLHCNSITGTHQPVPGLQNAIGVGIVANDGSFMQRVADSQAFTYKEPLTSNKGSVFPGPGFTEMIRGITRLPTAADVQSLMQGRTTSMGGSAPTSRTSATSNVGKEMQKSLSCSPEHITGSAPPQSWKGGDYDGNTLKPPDDHQHWTKLWDRDTQSKEVVYDGNKTSVLPLPLFPEGPLRLDSRASDSSLTVQPSAAQASPSGQPATVDVTFAACGKQAPIVDVALIDEAYLEHVYGASSEPVLLLDDKNHVVWSNRSYDRASKCSCERTSYKDSLTGPYIDPLGHPTPLGTLFVKKSTSKLTLWGFLKKLVVGEPGEPVLGAGRGSSSYGKDVLGSSNELSLQLGDSNVASASQDALDDHIHAPVHPSTVPTITLEHITDLHLHCSPVMESLQSVEAWLFNCGPAFITDSMLRVRWVNSSLLRMLGHTEGAWPGVIMPFLNVYSAESLPQTVSAFSGRVNMEWVQAGKRRSSTIPCDVCLLIPSSSAQEMWIWRLDASASLGLAFGSSC